MTDIEDTTKNIRGREDCEMKNGEWTDRYERLTDFEIINPTTKYQTIEIDSRKGMRLMKFYFNGAIYKERKWSRLSNKGFRFINPNKKIDMDLDKMLDEHKLK